MFVYRTILLVIIVLMVMLAITVAGTGLALGYLKRMAGFSQGNLEPRSVEDVREMAATDRLSRHR